MNNIKKTIILLVSLLINNGFALNSATTFSNKSLITHYPSKTALNVNIDVNQAGTVEAKITANDLQISFNKNTLSFIKNCLQKELELNPNLADKLKYYLTMYVIKVCYMNKKNAAANLQAVKSFINSYKRLLIFYCDGIRSILQEDLVANLVDPENNIITMLNSIITMLQKDAPVNDCNPLNLADNEDLLESLDWFAHGNNTIKSKLRAFVINAIIASGLSENDLRTIQNFRLSDLPDMFKAYSTDHIDSLINDIENAMTQDGTKDLVKFFGAHIKTILEKA